MPGYFPPSTAITRSVIAWTMASSSGVPVRDVGPAEGGVGAGACAGA